MWLCEVFMCHIRTMVSDRELEALSTLRGLRGAPRVPPVNCRAIFRRLFRCGYAFRSLITRARLLTFLKKLKDLGCFELYMYIRRTKVYVERTINYRAAFPLPKLVRCLFYH